MNLKRSPFSILDKDKREMDYIKGVYKRKIQAEIESYKDPEEKDKRDTIQAQDVLMIDRISICLLYTSPSPRDLSTSRMPSSA